MNAGRSADPDPDVVVCADVLGAFGVTPDDVRAQRREFRSTAPPGTPDADLESILADVLADARDRTATVRQLICHGDRGLSCSARYAQRALGRELAGVFDAIGWSLEWSRTGPAPNGRDHLELTATDPNGRRRETTVTYPETPLADDNLPAVLRAVDERLLDGTDATMVLLSTGVDRWRAALLETDDLAALRERYGDRIAAFDRPLLPADGLEAFVPDEGGGESGSVDATADTADDDGPWPDWALERAERRAELDAVAEPTDGTTASQESVDALIDEAEPERTTGDSAATPGSDASTTTSPATEAGGFEIRGGSPTVSRLADDGSDETDGETRVSSVDRSSPLELTGSDDDAADGAADDGDDSGFGTLSGTTTTTRVTNDSFGSGEGFETEGDRYRALGAALGAGGAVTVEGLLEDDEFLPELPEPERVETRIEFEETFDPDAVSKASAAAEQEGFEWVDAGSLETTRLSNR